MPESKHRRGWKNRPRAHQTHAPEKKPPPSPTWVPRAGVGLVIAGVVVILLGYVPAIADAMRSWPPFGSNWGLIVGFVLMVAGLGFLTRWR